jgi:hypothetical protein
MEIVSRHMDYILELKLPMVAVASMRMANQSIARETLTPALIQEVQGVLTFLLGNLINSYHGNTTIRI